MQNRIFLSICASTAAAVLLCPAVSAQVAAPQVTVIDSLPYPTITQSGYYVVNRNLSSSQTTGYLISVVGAANVTIDLQGYNIAAVPAAVIQGIYASRCDNLTIKNGTISGVDTGVGIDNINGSTRDLNANKGLRISNIRVTSCSLAGIILQSAPGGLVTNCTVAQIGNTSATAAFGIIVNGTATTVQGCTVANVVAASSSPVYGIVFTALGSFATQNQVTNTGVGISGSIRQNNLVSACPTPFASGTDAGGNTSAN